MKFGVRQIAWAAMIGASLAVSAAHAASHQLDGQFLSASYDDAGLPAGFGQVSLRESSPVWDCTSGACALTAPLSVAVVFAPTSGQAVAVTSQALDFSLDTLTKSQVLVDPLGQHWDVSADAGKWLIGVDIASQAPQGQDAQFATAYGRFGYTSPDQAVAPSWPDGLHFVADPELGFIFADSRVLGLKESGAVGVGPGSSGIDVSGGGAPWQWSYRTQLDGANYAYPSTTDVHCTSLSCMTFKTGVVNVNNYFLSFDVKAVVSAVPEAGTLPLMALGLAGVSLLARRRRQG